MVLTAQGTPFIHSGQEYGRTKQFRDPAYRYPVSEDKVPNKSHLLVDEKGNPFDYPYFIHDSYDSVSYTHLYLPIFRILYKGLKSYIYRFLRYYFGLC